MSHNLKWVRILFVVYSVSQSLTDERHAIMRLIESNGGVFSSHMEQDICTHLICLRPEGAKFEAARTWRGVRVVTRQWADDCVTRGSVKQLSCKLQIDFNPLIILFFLVW